MNTEVIELKKLKCHKANPRLIKDYKFQSLINSLLVFPEMLELRPIVVDNKFEALGGNMRTKALLSISQMNDDEIAQRLNKLDGYKSKTAEQQNNLIQYWKVWKDKPIAHIVKADSLTEDQKREFMIKDNSSFGEWDMDALANEWNLDELNEWGLELNFPVDEISPAEWNEAEEGEEGEYVVDPEKKNEEAETLLNKAMQQYCLEFKEQIDTLFPSGYLFSGMTEGFAKIKFLYAKYYGAKYPRYCSLIFTPQQFRTSACKTSYYEQLEISGNEGKAGIAGFRTLTHAKGDSLMCLTTDGGYPVGGSRMPLDFPVELARELIAKYGEKGNVLDPCHGWGGRLVGALLEDVNSYTGIDPSPFAHEGLEKIKKAFLPYTRVKEVNLIQSPFEDTKLKKGYYDFALTSPPYFDVEQYDGEETSTLRYPKFELWVEKFYRPLICKTYDYLKKGGCFALQVGSQSYPLKKTAIQIAENVGFSWSIYGENVLCGTQNNKLHNTDKEDGEVVILLTKD